METGVLTEDVDQVQAGLSEMLTRDLSVFDKEPVTDSAEEFEVDPVSYCESLQAQIDDMEERVDGLTEIAAEGLTKPTWFERIAKLFS